MYEFEWEEARQIFEWEEVKQLNGDDPLLRAVVLRGPHGYFRVDAYHWRINDEGHLPEHGWWACNHESGLYGTAEAAEEAARMELPWLRPKVC